MFILNKKECSEYVLDGRWCIDNVSAIQKEIDRQTWPRHGAIHLSNGPDFQLDTSGAWLITQMLDVLNHNDIQVDVAINDRGLLNFLEKLPQEKSQAVAKPWWDWVGHLEEIGRWVIQRWNVTKEWLDFFGHLLVVFMVGIVNLRHLRLKSVSRHLYSSGVQAIPIVALIAFLISVVLAYQGAMQLTRFGADIYTVDLVAVSVLREMGVLLTAIMVAGRSGSAFAAEIGVMKINQEVDAIRVMGMDPMEVLVLPRALALIIALPLLTLVADLMGIAGSALLSYLLLNIPLVQFLERIYELVSNDISMFWVGLIKAPFFALLIAAVGTLRGMQVETSAERVGSLTTQAVVESIFLVILADALFSILFSRLGL